MIELAQEAKILSADMQTPVSLYLDIIGKKNGILLESAEVDGRLGKYSLLAWDFILELGCEKGLLSLKTIDPALKPLENYAGKPFLEGLQCVLDNLNLKPPVPSLPALTRSLIGYFGYGSSVFFEPKLRTKLSEQDAEIRLVLPSKILLFEHLYHRCVFISLGKQAKLPRPKALQEKKEVKVGELKFLFAQNDFEQAVAKAKELIRQGEAIQVVLSTLFKAPFKGDPFSVYRRLRLINPSPYMFFMRFENEVLVGSSPELMVKCEQNRLELRPIAGTRPRGQTPQEDEALAKELLADEKERAEHVMLVDLGRNDLGRIATGGSVHVDKFMQIEKFSHVMHLTSYLRAHLKPGLGHLDVLQATFPAGTVSGAPKIRAMEIIADLEPCPRGIYAGAVGWLGLDKDSVNLDTGIAIRTLWFRNGQVFGQAGAGIVFDSQPEKEWQECQNKAKAIIRALTQKGDTDDFVNRQL
ncbi:MAG: anthranilate synthase component I family protein [Desulfonauticus sp.]|nr:anthranilate synthase component I family protein [Desulfonauticus sp.]